MLPANKPELPPLPDGVPAGCDTAAEQETYDMDHFSEDIHIGERLMPYLPQLLGSPGFRKDFESTVAEHTGLSVLHLLNDSRLDEADLDVVHDAMSESFLDNADVILTLGWDGTIPGSAGAVWVNQLQHVLVVTSTDYAPQGPFESIEQALECECFHRPTPRPELYSDLLPLDQLVKIAHGVVDWENDAEIWINSELYVNDNGRLVPGETE